MTGKYEIDVYDNRESLKSLRLALDREGFTTQQLNTAISQMTNEEMAADMRLGGTFLEYSAINFYHNSF